MIISKENNKFEQVAGRIDPQSKLLRAWDLKGGVSARVTALEVLLADGQVRKVIVRQHGEGDLRHNPHIAEDEFRLLQYLHSVGLAVPMPYLFDQSGEIFPTPYIVIEYIEGKTEFAPTDVTNFVLQLATHLARIHHVDGAKLDLSFLPRQEKRYTEMLEKRPAQVDESLDEGRIRNVLEAAWPLSQQNASVLLHCDFWPGNVLWRDRQLVGIIDWEDAAIGDPLADIANTRLELLWACGGDIMRRFTQQYQLLNAIDFSNLPYWDLCAALRPIAKISSWGLDDATEKTMCERHRWFVGQAFEKLASLFP